MTIRGKLNLVMLSLLGMLLATTAVVVSSVRTSTRKALAQATAKELSVFTDNVRAEVFYQTAIAHGFTPLRENDWWPEGVLDDLRVRESLSTADIERESWSVVRSAVAELALSDPNAPSTVKLVSKADYELRKLRRYYDGVGADATAETATAFWTAQALVVSCAGISVLLVTIATLFIRDWFVKPMREFAEATGVIGSGQLDHRIVVRSNDELGHLARRMNEMSASLADHQKQLIMTREMAAIGELCTNVAHGLRNPLAGMRAAAQLASRRADHPESLKGTLEDIVAEVDRMDERITQLFEFARSAHIEKAPTNFEDVLRDAESLASGVLRAKGIDLVSEDNTGDTTCLIDRGQLSAAIGELITNAAHHTDESRPIKVIGSVESGTNGDPPHWRVSILDRGKGITDAVRKHLFDLFFTTRPNGTGMGLPLVQRIVQRHGGTLTLDSTPGNGTTATISLSAGICNQGDS